MNQTKVLLPQNVHKHATLQYNTLLAQEIWASFFSPMVRHNRISCKCLLHATKRVFYRLPRNVYCIFSFCLYKSWRFSKTIHERVKSSRLNPQISICDARQTHCALRETINAPNKQINESQPFISVRLCATEKSKRKEKRECAPQYLNSVYYCMAGQPVAVSNDTGVNTDRKCQSLWGVTWSWRLRRKEKNKRTTNQNNNRPAFIFMPLRTDEGSKISVASCRN